MDQRSRPELSPVIAALRMTSDEVQLGRVLAAICRDVRVARAFCETVLNHAVGGAKRVEPPPEIVTCLDERVFDTRLSRKQLRQRVKSAGRFDLDFAGADDWRLIVELKINDVLDREQQNKLLAQGVPVAAVVRDPEKVPTPEDSSNWVGAASWQSLRDDLHRLPISEPAESHWKALLNVVEFDRDFEKVKPRQHPEVEAARALLDEVAPLLVGGFRAELERAYGRAAEPIAKRLAPGKVTTINAPWAGFPIRAAASAWLWIELRDYWSRAPRLRVWLYPPEERPVRGGKARAREAIRTHGFLERGDAYVYEDSVESLSRADRDRALEVIEAKITPLVDGGAFDADIERGKAHEAEGFRGRLRVAGRILIGRA